MLRKLTLSRLKEKIKKKIDVCRCKSVLKKKNRIRIINIKL